ncbi:MAG: glycoside hydrolase 43 family protein, partial [Rhizobiaceae bacterium]
MSCLGDWPNGRLTFPLAEPVALPADGPVELAVEVEEASEQFYWRVDGDWRPIGPALDASLISDEAGRGEHGSFTGAFVGMVAFDISGSGRPADFDRFSYEAR